MLLQLLTPLVRFSHHLTAAFALINQQDLCQITNILFVPTLGIIRSRVCERNRITRRRLPMLQFRYARARARQTRAPVRLGRVLVRRDCGVCDARRLER
jgi:hypothetical protein